MTIELKTDDTTTHSGTFVAVPTRKLRSRKSSAKGENKNAKLSLKIGIAGFGGLGLGR